MSPPEYLNVLYVEVRVLLSQLLLHCTGSFHRAAHLQVGDHWLPGYAHHSLAQSGINTGKAEGVVR